MVGFCHVEALHFAALLAKSDVMRISTPPTYRGMKASIATLHHKETVIAPTLSRFLGVELVKASGVDTDALGTFTGDVARIGSMADAARRKANLAIAATGASLAVASEGSFGPHPSIPFIPAGHELLLWRDTNRNMDVVVSLVSQTNYWTGVFAQGNIPDDAKLVAIGFPEHALTVRPANEPALSQHVYKGIRNLNDLRFAIDAAARNSKTEQALVQTDMRAHMNPTRMKAIRRLTRKLAVRLARHCPDCGTPGFGLVDVKQGLPCEDCGMQTRLISAEIHGCAACDHKIEKRQRPASLRANAMWCDHCNP
jgi:hypothetical protein